MSINLSKSELVKQKKHNEIIFNHYIKIRNITILKLVILIFQVFTIWMLSWLAFSHFPVTKFLWTRDAKSVCKITKPNPASISQATLRQFSADAAASLYKFNYASYAVMLNTAADRYLTYNGRTMAENYREDKKLIQTVRYGYYIVMATVEESPEIVLSKQEERGSDPYWVVKVPLTIHYSSKSNQTGYAARFQEKEVLTLKIIGVEPTVTKPEGLAVDSILFSSAPANTGK